MLLTRLAYPFAIVAGVLLMVAEMHVPDWAMVVLLCATIIGHVWLTGRAVRLLMQDERKDALATFTRAITVLSRQRLYQSGPAPQSDPDQPPG